MDDIFDHLKESYKIMLNESSSKKVDEDDGAGAEGESTTTNDIAFFADRLGKLKKRKVQENNDEKLDDAKGELANAIKAKAKDMEEKLNEVDDEEIDSSISLEDDPEANPDMDFEDEESEHAPGAEEAENVINKILAKYPNAVITLTVELPEDEPFNTDDVAAATEITSGEDGEVESNIEDNFEGDAEVVTTDDAEDKIINESRKSEISRKRNLIKNIYKVLKESEDDIVDDTSSDIEDVSGSEEVADVTIDDENSQLVEPKIEVTDTKITLTPEQWEQVIATSDILDTDIDVDVPVDNNSEPDTSIDNPEEKV